MRVTPDSFVVVMERDQLEPWGTDEESPFDRPAE